MLSENPFPNILRLVTPGSIALKIEALKLDAFLQTFSPGQTLSGQVLETYGGGKALLELNGKQVLTESAGGLKARQPVSVKVEGDKSQPVLRLLPDTNRSSSGAVPGKEKFYPPPTESKSVPRQDTVQFQRKPNAPLPKSDPVVSAREVANTGFRPEQPVTAVVEGHAEPGVLNVRVGTQSFQVPVPGNSSFLPGQEIQIVFKSQGKGFVASLVSSQDSAGVTIGKFLNALHVDGTARQPLGRLIQDFTPLLQKVLDETPKGAHPALRNGIEKIIREAATHQVKTPTEKEISSVVDKSGVRYESRLQQVIQGGTASLKTSGVEADLKGKLLFLQKLLAGVPAEPGQEASPVKLLQQQVQHTLQNIEMQQLGQYIARQENLPLLIQIPSLMEGFGDTVKVFFRKEGEEGGAGKSGQDSFHLVFFLDMSQLGGLRMDVNTQQQNLSIQLTVESEEVLSFLSSQFEAFEQHLAANGFNAKLEGRVQADAALEVPDEMAPLMVNLSHSLVDLTT